MKQTYIRCPRCELNYILSKDKFCNVCKAEMKAQGTLGIDEENDLELCPICKVNYISSNEDMCQQCAIEHGQEDEDADNVRKQDDNWDANYMSSDDDESTYDDEESGDMVSISNLDDTPIDDEMDLDLSADEEEDSQDLEEDNLDDRDNNDFDDDIEDDDDFDFDDEDDDEIDEDDLDDDDDDDDYKKPSRK